MRLRGALSRLLIKGDRRRYLVRKTIDNIPVVEAVGSLHVPSSSSGTRQAFATSVPPEIEREQPKSLGELQMVSDLDAFTEWTSQPFQPQHSASNNGAADVGDRVALALEYIAAQLGEICRKMDHIGSGFSSTKEDFDRMNELLRKL